MIAKQRATSQEEKLKKREAILSVAAELLAGNDYRNISIASIAQKAGLAKGTIFLYFKTKEELFLKLQIKEYKSWFEDINKRLSETLQLKKDSDVDRFVNDIMASLQNHPTMIQLTPLIHVVFEQNIDYETALNFKRFLLEEVQATGHLIERCLPFLQKNAGAQLLLNLQILLVGVIQVSAPAPIVRQVVEAEKMEAFQIDFEEKLSQMLRLILKGARDQ